MKRHSGIDHEASSKRRKADNDGDGLFVYQRRVFEFCSNDEAGYFVGRVVSKMHSGGLQCFTLEVPDIYSSKAKIDVRMGEVLGRYHWARSISIDFYDELQLSLKGAVVNERSDLTNSRPLIEVSYREGITFKLLKKAGSVSVALPRLFSVWCRTDQTSSTEATDNARGMMVPSIEGSEDEFTILNHSHDRPVSSLAHNSPVSLKEQQRPPLMSSINRPEARITSESELADNMPSGTSAPFLPKGDWVALSDINEKLNGQTFSVIAIASEVWGPQPSRGGEFDLVMRLRLVDKSNLNACRGVHNASEYGFKVNLFATKENGRQWLPHMARESNVVILYDLKTTNYSGDITAVGHKEKLRWAIYDPATGQATQRDVANELDRSAQASEPAPPPFPVSPEDLQICAQLDKWWKSERLKAGYAVEETDDSVGQTFSQRSLVSSHSDTVLPSDSRGLVTIREILDDDRDCCASFSIEASVVGHTPAPVENYVSMWCNHLGKETCDIQEECWACVGKPGKSHSFTYQLQFELKDEAGDRLFVDVNEYSRPLEGFPPVDLRKDSTACAEVRRRLRSYVGDTFEPNLQKMMVARMRSKSGGGWCYKLL